MQEQCILAIYLSPRPDRIPDKSGQAGFKATGAIGRDGREFGNVNGTLQIALL